MYIIIKQCHRTCILDLFELLSLFSMFYTQWIMYNFETFISGIRKVWILKNFAGTAVYSLIFFSCLPPLYRKLAIANISWALAKDLKKRVWGLKMFCWGCFFELNSVYSVKDEFNFSYQLNAIMIFAILSVYLVFRVNPSNQCLFDL